MNRASITALVPDHVLARLGPAPEDLSRLGSFRVLRGNGLVLKVGPEDRVRRESFVGPLLTRSGALAVPPLLDAGPSWLLYEALDGVAWGNGPEPLGLLARLHDAFEGSPALDDLRLRDVLGRELDGLLAETRSSDPRLPEPLALLLADPTPLVDVLRDEPRTLVHGDAWPGNVLATRSGPAWFDWEEAGAAPAAYDVAVWLHGSPWVPASAEPARDLAVYSAARPTIDFSIFTQAVDAATVLIFLALDAANIDKVTTTFAEGMVERRRALAESFV
ncbi:MAG TPA: phosphotransferase [Gaiellaceae bacterium]|nr:phosphotransferase [Gaiellaceae bacterium]